MQLQVIIAWSQCETDKWHPINLLPALIFSLDLLLNLTAWCLCACSVMQLIDHPPRTVQTPTMRSGGYGSIGRSSPKVRRFSVATKRLLIITDWCSFMLISFILHSPKHISLWWRHSTRPPSVTGALPSWWGSYVKVVPVKVRTEEGEEKYSRQTLKTWVKFYFNDSNICILMLNKFLLNVEIKTTKLVCLFIDFHWYSSSQTPHLSESRLQCVTSPAM